MSKKVNKSGILRRFARDQRGTIAMLSGLAAIPMLVAAGLAVDMARASQMKADFQAALDSAALAVATSDRSNIAGLTPTEVQTRLGELKEIAQDYIDRNYKPDFYFDTIVTVNVTIPQNGTVVLNGDHDYPTTIMRIVGINYVDVTAQSRVERKRIPDPKVEIALAMDTTGSMQGQKLADAKQAAKDLLNIVFDGAPTSPYVKAALVPFAQTVNVGTSNANAAWLDTNGLADYSNDNFLDSTWHNMRAWNALSNRPWTGCVEARKGALDTNDQTVAQAGNDALFTPWFAPDEIDNGRTSSDGYSGDDYYNKWANDSATGLSNPRTVDKWQRNQAKYPGKAPNTSNTIGPWFGCKGTVPIQPLTNSRTALFTAIDSMTASNYTHVVQGAMWGWRVLSPNEPFTEGAEYDDPEWKKILVIMTDGANTYPRHGNYSDTHNKSSYSAYGYLNQGRLGTTSYNTAITRLDERLTTACTNAKAQGIEVWTVAFDVDDQPGIQNLLRNCATDASKFLNAPDGATLRQQFQAIAGDILANSLYLAE
jgi:Flp pilus assembly protein TadG